MILQQPPPPERPRVDGAEIAAEEILNLVIGSSGSQGSPYQLRSLWRPVLPDAQDDIELETAVNGRADLLVTPNRRHFGPAAPTFAIEIVSPREAVERLRKRS